MKIVINNYHEKNEQKTISIAQEKGWIIPIHMILVTKFEISN